MSSYKEMLKKFAPILLAIILWFIAAPAGVTVAAWHTTAIFLGFMLGCVLNSAPLSVMAIVAMGVLSITQTMPPVAMFGGFGLPVIWLIMSAFFVAIGFRTTSLGERIAYYLLYKFGKTPISMAYALTLCDIIIAPFVPNTNARGAGIFYPITYSLSQSLGSDPEKGTERKIGAYLMLTSFQQNLIAGGLFLTAMSTNPLAVQIAHDSFGITINWAQWFTYASVPTIIALIITPLIIYKIYRPEVTKIPHAQEFAKKHLDQLGKISRNEVIMIFTFILMIILWATSKITMLDNGVVALFGLMILLVTGVLSLDDILNEKKAWNIFIWLAPIMAMTSFMAQGHVVDWIKNSITQNIHGLAFPVIFVALILIYFYIHYFLTSMLVHIQTFLLPFAGVFISYGIGAEKAVMIFALLTCFSAITTHYGTGTGSIYFATGYVTQRDWWRVGFIVSAILVIEYTAVGFLWWTLLGL